jgi:hypothetical protein
MTSPDGADERGIDRRRLLKTIGATTAGLVAVSGTATAHRSQFTGCERVCTGTDGSFAVVAVDGTVTCREMTATDGVDVPWDWQSYCYEAADDETVIGILEENVVQGSEVDPEGSCTFCPNPNACAEDAYDSVAAVVSTLDEDDTCGVCAGHVEAGSDCTTYTKPGDDGTDGSDEDGDTDGDQTDDTSGDETDANEDETDGSSSGDENEDEDTGGESETEDPAADFDTTKDYDDDREVWKSDLVETDSSESPDWECENTTEDPTAMELWYDRDDTPVDPRDRERCGPDAESAEDSTLTALERWFARDDTPDRSN